MEKSQIDQHKTKESQLLEFTKETYKYVFFIMVIACITSLTATLLVKDFSSRRILFIEIIFFEVEFSKRLLLRFSLFFPLRLF